MYVCMHACMLACMHVYIYVLDAVCIYMYITKYMYMTRFLCCWVNRLSNSLRICCQNYKAMVVYTWSVHHPRPLVWDVNHPEI